MESGEETPSIALLQKALREQRNGEARSIARALHRIYRGGDHPRSLLAFIESVLADDPTREEGAHVRTDPPAESRSVKPHPWHALPGADIAAMRRALGLWNQLHPGNEPLCAPGDREPARLTPEDVTHENLAGLLIGGSATLPWLDAWFVGSHQLRVRIGEAQGRRPECTAMGWELLQWEPERKRLAGCGCIKLNQQAQGLHDLRLIQPVAPLLMLGGDGKGGVAEIRLLAFPSLLRHGVHHGELVSELGDHSDGDALRDFSLNCLVRLLQGQHPRVRSWSVRPPDDPTAGWMTRPSVQAGLEQISAVEPLGNAASPGTLHLTIKDDGLPSLRALTGLAEAPIEEVQGEAAFLVVDACSLRPLLQVRPGRQPAGMTAAIRVEDASGAEQTLHTPDTVAIAMATEDSPRRRPLWWPTDCAPGARQTEHRAGGPCAVEVVITEAADPEDLQFTLWGLSQQQGIRIERLWLPPGHQAGQRGSAGTDALLSTMHASGMAVERGGVGALAALLKGCRSRETLLCLMTAGMCLHEPATLEVLVDVLSPREVASAGCLLIHERHLGRHRSVETSSCGLVPATLAPLHGNGLNLVQQTLQGINAMGDRSVIANLSDLVLVDPDERHWPEENNTTAWQGELLSQWLNASLWAILQGSLHRATPRISAHYRRAPRSNRRFHAELAGRGMALGGAIHQLLAASTCSRRLKP